jgi:hypothetical protein
MKRIGRIGSGLLLVTRLFDGPLSRSLGDLENLIDRHFPAACPPRLLCCHDETNPIAELPPVNGVLSFFSSLDESLMERLQREFPATRFVKPSIPSAIGAW